MDKFCYCKNKNWKPECEVCPKLENTRKLRLQGHTTALQNLHVTLKVQAPLKSQQFSEQHIYTSYSSNQFLREDITEAQKIWVRPKTLYTKIQREEIQLRSTATLMLLWTWQPSIQLYLSGGTPDQCLQCAKATFSHSNLNKMKRQREIYQ